MQNNLLLLFFYCILYTQNTYAQKYLSLSEALKTKPKEVRILSLKQMGLEQIPKEIKKFKNLEILDLSNNQITKIPY